MNKRMCKRTGIWFECSAKFVDGFDGTTKKNKVCVEADSFATAEYKAIGFINSLYDAVNDLRITAISIASYTEVYFREKCGDWFKASMKALDSEKDVVLLSAEDIVDAHSTLDDEIIGPAQHWFLTKIEQTNIVGVATDEEINYDDAPTE